VAPETVASGTIPERADFEMMQGQSYAFDALTPDEMGAA
jgi:hypothetical protein